MTQALLHLKKLPPLHPKYPWQKLLPKGKNKKALRFASLTVITSTGTVKSREEMIQEAEIRKQTFEKIGSDEATQAYLAAVLLLCMIIAYLHVLI